MHVMSRAFQDIMSKAFQDITKRVFQDITSRAFQDITSRAFQISQAACISIYVLLRSRAVLSKFQYIQWMDLDSSTINSFATREIFVKTFTSKSLTLPLQEGYNWATLNTMCVLHITIITLVKLNQNTINSKFNKFVYVQCIFILVLSLKDVIFLRI